MRYRDQNCVTYEMTGALEFNLPLYDGGYYRPEAHRIELHYDAAQSCGGGGVSLIRLHGCAASACAMRASDDADHA